MTVLAPGAVLKSGRPGSPLSGEIRVPGDKSLSHRALILGGLADGETRIKGLLEGDDVLRTAAAVRSFGALVARTAPGEWRVRGGSWRSPDSPIDCGNSGTGARLVMGAAAGFPMLATFTGDASLSVRPMERVLAPLRAMGAMAEGNRLPVTLHGGGLQGIRFINETASAQVKSAILLAGLNANGEVEIIEPRPSRDHTEIMLRAFGCELTSRAGTVRLGKRRELQGASLTIPGDPSSAAFPIVAALIVPGSALIVRDLLINPLRTGLFKTLVEMGANLRIENERVAHGERIADIFVEASHLVGVDVPGERAPSMIDEYPVLAVAAAFATGPTRMAGLSELRVKESNRFLGIAAGLRAFGVEVAEDGDSLVVEGRGLPAGGCSVRAGRDHRIAMAFLVMGLGSKEGAIVDSADMIATSFPGFAPLMRSIGAAIE